MYAVKNTKRMFVKEIKLLNGRVLSKLKQPHFLKILSTLTIYFSQCKVKLLGITVIKTL